MIGSLHIISQVSKLAGLLHDIGKATDTFQRKLTDPELIGLDVMRHERLSCAIFSSLYSSICDSDLMSNYDDRDFFSVIHSAPIAQLKSLFQDCTDPGKLSHFYGKTNIDDLSAVIWNNSDNDNVCIFNAVYFLILTHHKLPVHNDTDIKETYVIKNNAKNNVNIEPSAPFFCDTWLAELQNQCKALCELDFNEVYKNINAFTSALLYIARPALVIADQHVSSKATENTATDSPGVYANSVDGRYAQRLDDHLYNVSDSAFDLTNFMLSDIKHTGLPSIIEAPNSLTEETAHNKFKWQNEAAIITASLKPSGNLILISSETGSGKTRANIKVASSLRNNSDLRLTTLLGMNTLTKQTANEYINDMLLADYSCAITGHAVTRHEIESANGLENLNIDSIEVSKSSFTLDDKLTCSFKSKYNKILATPIVVSTIDHLVECVESGRSTASRLIQRVQTSDLIIDEIDSYNDKSLVSIYKLVYLAAFFNRNVIVSSATMRPALARNLLDVFSRGLSDHNTIFNTDHVVSGAVINNLPGTSFAANDEQQFNDIISKQPDLILSQLNQANMKRRLKFLDYENESDVLLIAKQLHDDHSVKVSGFNFSAGVIRLNKTESVKKYAVALSKLTDNDTEIAVICYHSRIDSIVRYSVEKTLDKILKRKDDQAFKSALLADEQFKITLSNARKRNVKNIMLIAVCTNIIETGRDYDFDYAITEPSNNHSLIQLSGRVLRHRDSRKSDAANVVMLNSNGFKHRDLTLCDTVSVKDSFTCNHIDYTTIIDSSACLLDSGRKRVTNSEYSNVNDIEIQHIHNSYFNILEFIDNAHCRMSKSHADKYPLRDSNSDINVWYDGENYLMCADKNTTEICNWITCNDELKNLWFNVGVDKVINRIEDSELKKLMLSENSSFSITRKQSQEMRKLKFNPAISLR